MNRPMLFNPKRNGVAVIVERKDGCVLACQRLNCRDMNGLWQFPGGAIEVNESAMAAASRELYEETGVAAPPRLTFLCAGVGLTPDHEIFVTQFFIARPVVDPLDFAVKNTEPDKHSDWEWVNPEELRHRNVIPLIPLALSEFKIWKKWESGK